MKGSLALAGVATLGDKLSKDISALPYPEIVTDYATIKFLYELHSLPPKASEIPENTDILFLEWVFPDQKIHNASVQELLNEEKVYAGGHLDKFIQRPYLEKLASK